MVATLDLISGGRMELGIGAGWLRSEYEAYGYDFPSAAIRLAQLREALDVVRLLWSGERVDYEGTHYQLRGAVGTPRPVQRPRPPILVGGGGNGLLAVAAVAADIVNIVPPTSAGAADRSAVRRFTLPAFARKAARLRALAGAAGRDPGEITLAGMFFVQLAETPAESRTLLAALAARYDLAPDEAARFPLVLIGTPAELRERLAERIALLELGYVVLQFPTGGALARFAAEVLPAVKSS
jgi:alkanesulfonate monooxygenase SsuD/methylene tetrahydromethanopterin reductase-like flavin-dependent oxidoreductase (luciferase family)